MTTNLLRKARRTTKTLWADTSGVILPYVTLMLVVIVGTAVLALDGGRYMSLQSQLQKGADALAIAGAAELDVMPNSTARAFAAVNNLITNSSVFAANVTVSAINFRETLPATDDLPLAAPLCSGGGCTADQSTKVRFIEVVVTPTTIPTILPASFFGGVNSVTASASAVAGMTQTVCKINPMFVCNPYELPDGSMSYAEATEALFNAMATPAIRRRLIQMRQGGGAGAFSPGNFGFLNAPLIGSGANALKQAIASTSPPACFAQNGVDTQPGFIATVKDAVNVRFDLYKGNLSPGPNYPPAINVRKGWLQGGGGGGGNPCQPGPAPATDPAQAMGLPNDNCFPDSCTNMGGRMGDGQWKFDEYWAVNHSGVTKPTVNGVTWSNTNPPSRYEVYRREIDAGLVTNPSPGGETGAPTCNGPGVVDPDRRLLFAAIVNCRASLPPSLPLSGGNNTGVPVVAFGKFFITRALEDAQDEINTELVELVTPGNTNGVAFDQAQLYR